MFSARVSACLGTRGEKYLFAGNFPIDHREMEFAPGSGLANNSTLGLLFLLLSLSARCRRAFLGSCIGAVLRGLRGTFGWQWVQRVLALSTPSPEACCPPHHHRPQLHHTQPCSRHQSCQVPGRGVGTHQIPSAPFCSLLGFLMKLETSLATVLLAPSQD